MFYFTMGDKLDDIVFTLFSRQIEYDDDDDDDDDDDSYNGILIGIHMPYSWVSVRLTL